MFFKFIREHFPHPEHVLHNGAIPATQSSYMSMCVNLHVPRNVDLVVVRSYPYWEVSLPSTLYLHELHLCWTLIGLFAQLCGHCTLCGQIGHRLSRVTSEIKLPCSLQVEFALNDGCRSESFDNPLRRSFERLLRRLLVFPNRPAIVLFMFSSFKKSCAY